ncbi:hypothetical protein [Ornithinibacillus californiensis]|uniref:hypothetical protein n=1 Tax=Ornithinibacillus californiensis TaxID=161536 RepID=UPI00064E1522|nr:hypothetical protein [Ornithinibacillus californiensis]
MQSPDLITMSYKEKLKEIVERSYSILLAQISNGRITIDNEASFQLQFSYILKVIGELHQFSPNDLFTIKLETPFISEIELAKSKSKKANIDITIALEDRLQPASKTSCAIELKYFQKSNHREPNNRYDAFIDLVNLEGYVSSRQYNFGVFILGTDHTHYFSKESYSDLTKDFDMRDGKTYSANTELVYRTETPHGPPIRLKNDYSFNWDQTNEGYFLKLLID